MARPTKYCTKLLEITKNYANNWRIENDVIPTVERLCSLIDVHRDTVDRWKKQPEKKEFYDTIEKIKATQRRELLNQGVSGVFSSSMSKFILTTNHKMIEVTESRNTGKDGKDLVWNVTLHSAEKGKDNVSKEETKEKSQSK